MVAAVQADRLKSDVETLVNFGTRNDFSERTSDQRSRRLRGARLDRGAVSSDRRYDRRTNDGQARYVPASKDGEDAPGGNRIERDRDPARAASRAGST